MGNDNKPAQFEGSLKRSMCSSGDSVNGNELVVFKKAGCGTSVYGKKVAAKMKCEIKFAAVNLYNRHETTLFFLGAYIS